MFVTPHDTPMPPHYQLEDCLAVYRSLQAGESCSLIGIGSVGKSNMLQNLTRSDFKARHIQQDSSYLLTVYLDPHTLIYLQGTALENTGVLWGGYELMLTRLYHTLRHIVGERDRRRDSELTTLTEAVGVYVDKIRSGDHVTRQSGIRHLEDALYHILSQDSRWQVVFLLDEVTDFIALTPRFFQTLRGLRDQYKGRVMYVTATASPLDALLTDMNTDDRTAMKDFVDLFRDHTRYIRPLDPESAAAVVDRFIERYKGMYNIYDRGKYFLTNDLYKHTGGHVGLMRRSFRPAVQYLIDDEPGLVMDYLLRSAGVRRECETILNSVPNEERAAFYDIMFSRRFDGHHHKEVMDALQEKHLITIDRGIARPVMELLAEYVRQYGQDDSATIQGARRR